jgi:hypothetical protein
MPLVEQSTTPTPAPSKVHHNRALVVTLFVVLVFVYSPVSRRLESTVITAPVLFTIAGAALLPFPDVEAQLLA